MEMEDAARFRCALEEEGGAAALWLLERAAALADAADDADAAALSELSALADDAYARCWERLHCGSWKDVAPVWREAFGRACLFKAWCQSRQGDHAESVKTLDMCLMMAGPHAPQEAHTLIATVERELTALRSTDGGAEMSLSRPRLEQDGGAATVRVDTAASPAIRFPVERVAMPSLVDFQRTIMKNREPVIITGAMDHWPAMGRDQGYANRNWSDVEYFRRVAGWRTVPVEVGSSYLEDDWRQELMTMSDFLDKYIAPCSDREGAPKQRQVGYLAQHHLFEQISVLGRDIMTPDYCVLRRRDLEQPSSDQDGAADEDDDDENIVVNAWFGPAGTVSPLHFDPKDNLLCQVVGAKYLRLYSPRESDKLYPVEGLLSNTSQVQVEAPSESVSAAFPKFQEAAYVECVLRAGEMLYIPPQYWHYVRSLSTSFSVSFWWD